MVFVHNKKKMKFGRIYIHLRLFTGAFWKSHYKEYSKEEMLVTCDIQYVQMSPTVVPFEDTKA